MNLQKIIKNIGHIQCRKCKLFKVRTMAGIDAENAIIYVNEKHKRWNRFQCHECSKALRILNSRKKGVHKDRSELTDHKNKLGFISEQLVKEYFIKMGFDVIQTSAHGPDLILEKDGFVTTCEVKTASKSSNANSWFVSPVYEKRRNDDYMAIVFPDGRIIAQPMRYHISQCSTSGRRTLTALARGLV